METSENGLTPIVSELIVSSGLAGNVSPRGRRWNLIIKYTFLNTYRDQVSSAIFRERHGCAFGITAASYPEERERWKRKRLTPMEINRLSNRILGYKLGTDDITAGSLTLEVFSLSLFWVIMQSLFLNYITNKYYISLRSFFREFSYNYYTIFKHNVARKTNIF